MPENPCKQGLLYPLFAEVPVVFALPFRVLFPALPLGTGWAIFGAVGSGEDRLAADKAALFRSVPHDLRVQLTVSGQDCVSEPFAQQRIGNALHTYARLPVIQQDAVAVVIVAAQPPDELSGPAKLLLVHTRQISHCRIPSYNSRAVRHLQAK